ncbi:urease accessory protein UreD [Noviherbaspirillum sedimenti]|uniref:Urease accessory protein UreD n=1 Tax=Noviherbaspirillum sedimenti TaxID=2320865 RepID=A0A3A3G978_9BURK|nr:urease accessory protein UreD [Noviherbaspirillum sedimenti]RJG04354.1 urease accessory protein UreD [Noviherbaspirillum sedimenti]
MPPAIPDVTRPVPARAHWQARLSLGFADDQGTTRLVECTHLGPLRVQKPLYPEGPGVCHAIVVHPPGGVVGGDQLAIAANLQDAARALVTTPGAAKWYRANGHGSRQDVRLTAGARTTLEWLPQETIFFNGADVQLGQEVVLAQDASYIGWDILCFGRTRSGESFDAGRIGQRTSVRRGGKLVWFEQGTIDGGGSAMHSPLSLAGHTVCATLIAVGKAMPAPLIQALREQAACIANGDGRTGQTGLSQMKQVCVLRYLGNSSETARQVMIGAWQLLRPALLARDAIVPRIWQT